MMIRELIIAISEILVVFLFIFSPFLSLLLLCLSILQRIIFRLLSSLYSFYSLSQLLLLLLLLYIICKHILLSLFSLSLSLSLSLYIYIYIYIYIDTHSSKDSKNHNHENNYKKPFATRFDLPISISLSLYPSFSC